MCDKIDFIITWVDESDPKWRKDFEYFSAKEGHAIEKSAARYRDWETLKYWFRGIEKFAPWVNKIYFVTYGHLPKWLNTDNPKLVIVKHEDFIPLAFLPTFNSSTIEFFFHKIEGLSDRFVYFNDDMFLIDSVSPERFFRKGLPCDIGVLTVHKPERGIFSARVLKSIGLINLHFNKNKVIRKNLFKWYHLSYCKFSIRDILFHKLNFFPGFINHHLPQGYLKKTYDDVWEHCKKDLDRSCSDKFRTYGDISHWLIRYWQLASGSFTPYNVFKDGKVYYLSDMNISDSVDCISHQKKKLVCLNDGEHVTHFEDYKERILRAFEQILPEKSSFEL